jgi:hypothetical protein
MRLLISALDLRVCGSRCYGRPWAAHRPGQPAAMEFGFLRGFALRDRGDEADPLHLPRRSSRWQRRPTSIGRLGLSLVMSVAASGGPPTTRTERADSPRSPPSLTDPITSRDGERSNSRVTYGSACSLTYGQKFGLNRPVFIGVLVPNRREQGLQHFQSLNRTLFRKDSEEIEKGIKSV